MLHTKSARHLVFEVSVRDSPAPRVRQFSYNEDSGKAEGCEGDTWTLDDTG